MYHRKTTHYSKSFEPFIQRFLGITFFIANAEGITRRNLRLLTDRSQYKER
jgi:hypothetical protein